MGFPYLLGLVHGLHFFPPFTLEIIVAAVLIILLACPIPLAEYYHFIEDNFTYSGSRTFQNEHTSHASQTLALTEDEDEDVEEISAIKKTRSKRPSRHNIAPKCDVPKALKRTTSLIKSIESTLKNIDKTNNDIIVNNLDICNKISDTTFVRAFHLHDLDGYKDDSGVAEKSAVDPGETGTEPLPDVDAGVDPCVLGGFHVDSEDFNVSNDSDLSVDSDEHGSILSDSDEEQGAGAADGVSVTTSSGARQPIALRRTDEITHLSGVLVTGPNEVNDEATTRLTKELSLTDLILDEKLDLSMIRERSDAFKRRHGDDDEGGENVSSESESTDDDLFVARRRKMADTESDSGLLDNVLNSPRNSERPHRSLDTLQGEVDYQDLYNISNEDLECNKQFFVDKFINDEEIKNHARFTRSRRKIFVEEIPIDNEKDHGSFGALDTLIESDLEAEDKYVNTKFIMNDFSSDSDVQIRGVGNAVLEDGNISGPCVFATGRSGVCEYDALTKISEEHFEMKETARYKSFSTLSDFKPKNTVLEKVYANSEAIICDDICVKRYETVLDYAVSAQSSTRSNPFLNALNSGPMQDLYMNKLIKGEDSAILESENMQKLNNTFKEFPDIGVANVNTPTLNTLHAHTRLPEKDVSLDKDVNKVTINKEYDLSQMPSRCRLIFGSQARPRPSNEDVTPKTESQDRSTANSFGISSDNSCWKFRENVRAKKIVFDKDTFLRRKEASFHVFDTNSGSMNNLFELSNPSLVSNNMYDVSGQSSCGKYVASTSYVESCKDGEESDSENEPTTSAGAAKLRTSRTSLPKFKLLLFKTKSHEKSNSDCSQKLSGNDVTDRLSLSKSRSKTSKRSRVFSKKESGVDSKEDQRCSVEEDDARAATSGTPDEDSYDDILDSNTFTKMFHKITRKLKGNNSKAATTTTTTTTTTRRENDKNMTVQNKLYVFKGNRQRVAAFPAEDPYVVDRNLRSLDYFYSELQSDHHSLKITVNKMNIPASGSSTDANTDLHLAPLMEDIDE